MSATQMLQDPIAEYRALVDAELAKLCGITYSAALEMSPRTDADQKLLSLGAVKDLPASKMALAFQRANGLEKFHEGRTMDVCNFNRWKIAAHAFGTEARGWNVGTDGIPYRGTDTGTVLRLVVAEGTDGFEFIIQESKEPVGLSVAKNDPMQRLEPPQVEFEDVATGIDIGETVSAAIIARRDNAPVASSTVNNAENYMRM